MRRFILTAFTLTVFLSASLSVCAQDVSENQEIEALKKAISELQTNYQNEIQALRSEIKALNKNQESLVVHAVNEKVEEKLSGTEGFEYVGRYDGPFEKGGLVVRDQSGFAEVSVGGYADIEFENFEDSHSTFDQHRWILNIGADLGDRLRFYSEYEIEHGGISGNNAGDGEAKVEQAWIDFLIHPFINLRAGALLVPFGRYNLFHDSDLQDLTDRPIVARDVIPTTWTESGAGFYGEFNPTIGSYEDLNLGYEFYVINGLDAGFSDTGLGGGKGSLKADNNNQKGLVGRFLMSPAIGQELGVSGYFGKFNNLNDNIYGVGIDALSTWGPLELVGEYAYFHAHGPAAGGDIANLFQGFYVQANYHFWPEFLRDTFLGRGFEDPTFTFVNRFGWADIDDAGDASTGDNSELRYTVGFNYRPVESWVLKLEYQFNNNDNESLERGNRDGFISSIAMGF
jgi:hypothetical protein